MAAQRILIPFVVLALLGATPPVLAGTTGKLAGTILNEKKEPLAGVTIRIDGARLGAVTDDSGRYFVVGVPAGTYTVRANLLGYSAVVTEQVTIQPDFTTTLDLSLQPEAVQLEEVKVEAERPLLQKDATGTTRFISADEIQRMPTRGYREATALQTGVVNYRRQPDRLFYVFEGGTTNQSSLMVRGGRANETAYFVDGFSQQDPLSGTSSTAISNNAIQEVVVLTGGFAPEYGRIMSGAVNVITREGASRYFGSLEALSDVFSGNWVGAPSIDYNIYDLSLGGPILPGRDNLTFYVSGERRWERDRNPTFHPGAFQNQLENGTSYVDSQGDTVFAGQTSDPDVKPNNSSGVSTLQGKLAWHMNEQMTLKAGGIGSDDDWREYVHGYLFDPGRMPRHQDRNRSFFGTFNHAMSARSFYNVGVNYFETMRKTGDGRAFDDLFVYSQDYQSSPPPNVDNDFPVFTIPRGAQGPYLQRESSYLGLGGSMTSQVSPHHQLKLGADFQYHTLRLITISDPVSFGGPVPNLRDIDGYGYQVILDRDASGTLTDARLENVDDGLDGAKHPKTFSLYMQDKFEREGVVVNGGLRLDYLDVDTPALVNERHPLGDPSNPANNPDTLEAQDLKANPVYTRISPRLGIAFPLDERTILRFNYGQFYQQPNLQDLYVSYRYLQYLIRTHPYYVPIGNPNLRPERTTAYEAGFARQLSNNVRLDVTAYYKAVKDLVEVVATPGLTVSFFRNRDFATIKGIDFGFTVRPAHNLGANLSYSLSTAQGTGSSSTSQFRTAWLGGVPPKITAPLDYDQRHKLALTLDWNTRQGEGPRWGSLRPLENTSINAVLNTGSGTPYTPTQAFNEIAFGVTSARPSGSANSRVAPWASTVDLKVTRGFPIQGTRLEAYAWVLNLFNTRNVLNVYRASGDEATTGWLTTADGQAYLDQASQRGIDGQEVYQLAESNPNYYGNPRLVRFGIRASF